jgi:hypothetical protein
MKMPLYLRILLLLTLIGCGWLYWQDQAVNPGAPTPPIAAIPALPRLTQPEPAPTRTAGVDTVADVFPIQTWNPPPAPVTITNPTPAPPPLPFVVSAQWRYQNQSKIIVLRGNGNHYTLCNQCSIPGRVRPGGMLDKNYRLDKLSDTSVVLTYLPMKHVSTLHLEAGP